MKDDRPFGPLLDQAGDFVAVTTALLQHAEHEDLGAPLAQLRLQHRIFICRVFTYVNGRSLIADR
jgi:hypothetical protein